MTALLVLGKPLDPVPLQLELDQAVRSCEEAPLIRFGFAYATQAGLEALLGSLPSLERWSQSRKRWILGVHQGITEPLVIHSLQAMSRCEVRLFTAGERLRRETLSGGPRFHGKVVQIRNRVTKESSRIIASSANMTGAALGASAKNYEAGVALRAGDACVDDCRRFDTWWRQAWLQSLEASGPVISKYAALREEFLRRNPDAASQLDPPALHRLGEAIYLWIEAGAMSGGSRNQVEFSRELAAFFGAPERTTRKLGITARGSSWNDRPLSHKTTTFGVEIWRLSLPTSAQSGLSYPGKVILLKRSTIGGRQRFEIDVAADGSREHRRWLRASNRNGYFGVTSGGRKFGFF